MSKKTAEFSFRQSGKEFRSFLLFKAAILSGEKMIIRGPGYVVMADSLFDEITAEKQEFVFDEGVA